MRPRRSDADLYLLAWRLGENSPLQLGRQVDRSAAPSFLPRPCALADGDQARDRNIVARGCYFRRRAQPRSAWATRHTGLFICRARLLRAADSKTERIVSAGATAVSADRRYL